MEYFWITNDELWLMLQKERIDIKAEGVDYVARKIEAKYKISSIEASCLAEHLWREYESLQQKLGPIPKLFLLKPDRRKGD